MPTKRKKKKNIFIWSSSSWRVSIAFPEKSRHVIAVVRSRCYMRSCSPSCPSGARLRSKRESNLFVIVPHTSPPHPLSLVTSLLATNNRVSRATGRHLHADVGFAKAESSWRARTHCFPPGVRYIALQARRFYFNATPPTRFPRRTSLLSLR